MTNGSSAKSLFKFGVCFGAVGRPRAQILSLIESDHVYNMLSGRYTTPTTGRYEFCEIKTKINRHFLLMVFVFK